MGEKVEHRRLSVSKSNIMTGGYLLLCVFLLLLPATRSSFLYCFNDWDDANSYFTMGKALFHGMVPYRDLFDQKGMYLYFFYGLAYLMSHTTFAGVFVLEVMEGFFDLAAFYLIMRLYLKKSTSLILSPFVYAVIVCAPAFYWGGSAEEMNLPFMAWGLYLIIRYFRESYTKNKVMDSRTLFTGGLLAGMVANIKFIDLGFFFAWMMCVFFAFIAMKDVRGALAGCFKFLGGMAVPFVPWFIYFAVQKSLYWWYYGTVYINVFVYSNLDGNGPSLWERVTSLAKLLLSIAEVNICFFAFVITGVLWFIFGKGKKRMERFTMFALCFFLFLGIYVGGSGIGYYALPLSVFAVLGFVWIGRIVEAVLKKAEDTSGYLGGLLAVLVSIVFIWNTSMNIPFMSVKEEDFFLFRFRDIVTQVEEPTVLNYRCLDTGLATVSDALPAGYWFQTQTIAIDSIWDEQKGYMKDGIPKFVIARDEYPGSAMEKYDVVARQQWKRNGELSTYYLLERKDLIK